MSDHQALYAVVTMCRVLGVSPSGYYAWRQREPSARALSDASLTGVIRTIHKWSRGTYGVPRMVVELDSRGHHVNPKRVARLMREAGLEGVSRRKTLCVRAFSPPSSVSSSTAAVFTPTPWHAGRSSTTSRLGTTLIAVTRPSTTSRP